VIKVFCQLLLQQQEEHQILYHTVQAKLLQVKGCIIHSNLKPHVLNCLIQACLLLLKQTDFFILCGSSSAKTLQTMLVSFLWKGL